jgi:hypothetical protein
MIHHLFYAWPLAFMVSIGSHPGGTRGEHTMTPDRESEERGGGPLERPDGPAEPIVRDGQAWEAIYYGEAVEVPVVYATIVPLAWEDDEQVNRTIRCVTVEPNPVGEEGVSVTLTGYTDRESGFATGQQGFILFDLEPLDALALADELRRAAEASVVPCPCGRTLATMHDFTDTCPLGEQPTT